MSLQASMNNFKSDMSAAAARNLAHSRPNSTSTAPARTLTPQPGSKRPHDAVAAGTPAATSAQAVGSELITHMVYAVAYLKEKFPDPVSAKDIIDYLSLPQDLRTRSSTFISVLRSNTSIRWLKGESQKGKDMYMYRPKYDVRNGEQLKACLNEREDAQGIKVKELKDGWANCIPVLEKMAADHEILLTRNKKDGTPSMVWPDSPHFHLSIDQDFSDFWTKCKLPPSETELRNELEKANLTPTSHVKEPKTAGPRKKEKRKVNRRGGKTTNTHIMGMLIDYSKK